MCASMDGMSGMVSTVTIASDGARRFEAYLAQPAQKSWEQRPAILVLSDMFGLNEPIRAVADHYASRGHAALVPNLFWRSEIPGAISYDDPQHAKAWARLKALDLDVVSDDMKRGGRAGCGRSRSATARSRRSGSAAAAGLHSWPRYAAASMRRRRSTVSASRSISAKSKTPGVRCNCTTGCRISTSRVPRSTRSRPACAGGANVEVLLYPDAGHSFANPVRPTYDPAAAKLAGERIAAMLGAI